jgi:hypothetical protein
LKDERRELVPSAAALKARMVSSGLSMRLRVGLDRSGSAVADVNAHSLERVSNGEAHLSHCRRRPCASSTASLQLWILPVLVPLKDWSVRDSSLTTKRRTWGGLVQGL